MTKEFKIKNGKIELSKEELKKLLDKKVITNEDFIIRKRQILDK